MKLQQLRFLLQIVESNFNVTSAAVALHTSQSGVSRQIRLLEAELGVTILLRQEKRVLGLTDAGMEVVERAGQLMFQSKQLQAIARNFDAEEVGELTIATTHLHARYALLPVVRQMALRHPRIALRMVQTFPSDILQLVAQDRADLGITTDTSNGALELEFTPAYPLSRCLVVPVDHPLLRRRRPSLRDIARYPLIVYDARLSSGHTVLGAFEAAGIRPNVVLSAMDADVIKTYVAAGLGIAVMQTLAFDPKTDRKLRAIGMEHLFPDALSQIVMRRGKFLRAHTRTFIEAVTGLA